MGGIKKFFSIIFLTMITLIAVTYFSIKGEDEYQENCQTLGVHCDSGRVHKLTDKIKNWVEKNLDDPKK